ncbi:MAG: YggS family pyridoxal phosphate-dependent enzyme [Vallitaleaceae bacterium]|jgi:pyridoxal phosphate enzyme (YggS family)|nr:YggS family pyridoxal phosphate-dependent enzyme [Vallitaleaceae bacterium]
MEITNLEQNISDIQKSIQLHCKNCGRDTADVALIAVSKTRSIPTILKAVDCGMLDLGENKAQEIRDKYNHFSTDVRWHMIGHLQTNKIKYIIDKVVLIHSVDSIKLAKAIDKEASKKQIIMPILIQLNLSHEDSKFGIDESRLYDMVTSIARLTHIKIEGLMTVAPYVVDSEENRPIFRKMKDISVDIASKNIDNVSMRMLSMGMSGDYGVAIEEGATMIRVGTSIFGKRDYS